MLRRTFTAAGLLALAAGRTEARQSDIPADMLAFMQGLWVSNHDEIDNHVEVRGRDIFLVRYNTPYRRNPLRVGMQLATITGIATRVETGDNVYTYAFTGSTIAFAHEAGEWRLMPDPSHGVALFNYGHPETVLACLGRYIKPT